MDSGYAEIVGKEKVWRVEKGSEDRDRWKLMVVNIRIEDDR